MTDTNKHQTPLELFESARIGKKNFKGALSPFGEDRGANFRIYFTEDPERAADLRAKGYNIKGGDPIENTSDFYPEYLEVSVGKGPVDVWITNGNGDNQPTFVEKDQLAMLDSLRISNADVLVNGFEWKVGSKTGTKAYLRKLYVTVDKETMGLDPLTSKYGF